MDYQYRVVLVRNKKLHKVIGDYKRLKHAQNKFNKIKGHNQVLLPKVFINHKKIIQAEYEVLLLEYQEKNESSRMIQDNLGGIITEKSIGGWKILKNIDYFYEETFYVYGLMKRLNVAEILKEVFVPRYIGFYQVVMVLNKIVIFTENDIEVILTKNLQDCQRLYDYIFDFFKINGFFSLLFLGKANLATRKELYDSIQKHTGLTRKELFRTSTRS